jgi:hypothetical protein
MVSGMPGGSGSLEDVAEGQRWIIYAILVNIAALIARVAVGDIWALVALGSAVLAIAGVLRLAKGLGYSTGVKVLLVIAIFLPLVSLITLVVLSARANEALKAGGYKVGLLGAKR